MKTITSAVNSFLNWLLLSSADPTQSSLTFKGILVSLVPLTMIGLGVAHVNFGIDQVNIVINFITVAVQDLLLLIAAVMTLWGAIRKVYLAATTKVS